eukprot:12044008-Karenia_brevis.AAC.1
MHGSNALSFATLLAPRVYARIHVANALSGWVLRRPYGRNKAIQAHEYVVGIIIHACTDRRNA